LNLPRRTFILPLNCFQFPAKISQFISLSSRGLGDGRAPSPDNLTEGSVPAHYAYLPWRLTSQYPVRKQDRMAEDWVHGSHTVATVWYIGMWAHTGTRA
jgi:hypothetical protein